MQPYQPGAFWYSKISDFRNCARLGKLKHLDGVKLDEQPSADLAFGSAMHAGLNDLMTGGDGISVFRLFWDAAQTQDMDYGRLTHDELTEIGEVLLARFERLHLKHFKLYKAEERIHVSIDGFDFEGTPDCLADYKGVPSVIDFKTAAYRYDKRKIIADEQMPFYGELARAKYKYDAQQTVYVVFIKNPKAPSIQVLTRALTDVVRSSTLSNVVDTCRDIQERASHPRNTNHCVRGTLVCPYFKICHPDEGVNE